MSDLNGMKRQPFPAGATLLMPRLCYSPDGSFFGDECLGDSGDDFTYCTAYICIDVWYCSGQLLYRIAIRYLEWKIFDPVEESGLGP